MGSEIWPHLHGSHGWPSLGQVSWCELRFGSFGELRSVTARFGKLWHGSLGGFGPGELRLVEVRQLGFGLVCSVQLRYVPAVAVR